MDRRVPVKFVVLAGPAVSLVAIVAVFPVKVGLTRVDVPGQVIVGVEIDGRAASPGSGSELS